MSSEAPKWSFGKDSTLQILRGHLTVTRNFKEKMMFQLRSKTHFLTFGLALTTMFGLNAKATSQSVDIHQGCLGSKKVAQPTDATVLEASCQRCKQRPAPEKRNQVVYNQMAKAAVKTESAFGGSGRNKAIKTLQARGLCSSKQQTGSYTTTPNVLNELSPNGDTITIENGSAWSIAENDQNTARRWSKGSPLVITPNSLTIWAKLTKKALKYKYRIVNLETKASVQANLSLGPFINSPFTHKIRKVNLARGEVYCTNGTVWKLDNSKIGGVLLQGWKEGDYIMSGSNSTWYGMGMPQIMVNVTTDNWLPAKRIY
jgi:hypothetical protein